MKTLFKRAFLRDLERVPRGVKGRVEDLAFRELPAAKELRNIPNVVKLKGYDKFFRARIGDYRVGLELRDDTVVLMRVLDRKEIYRRFP